MYLEKFNLKGRTAVVTGSGQGIGFASAQALGEAGARVVVAELLPERMTDAVGKLRALGIDASGEVLDVTDSVAVEALAEKLEKTGGVQVLVNNAGVAKSPLRSEDTSDEHWRFHMAINLDGVFWCCRSFGKRMLQRGGGSIVNIGSMSGFIANKPQEQSFYNASKAAVHHLTRSLGAEWADRKVRVNAVAPTYIETPLIVPVLQNNKEMSKTWLEMTPMHRVGQPDEIASVVLFLACDASSLMTGAIVAADGGYICW
jgi:NAD(P)-dependent dehydrogenase (short-subunit alcohol dehydrogenase family)